MLHLFEFKLLCTHPLVEYTCAYQVSTGVADLVTLSLFLTTFQTSLDTFFFFLKYLAKFLATRIFCEILLPIFPSDDRWSASGPTF